MQMSPRIIIVFLPFHDGGFETPSAVGTDEFESVGVDAGVLVLIGTVGGDEVFAVGVGVGGGVVEVLGTEGVAFLGDETFVVSVIGFVGAPEDDSRSDVAAYEPRSITAGGFEGK